jgi:hypothetical protein
VVEGGKLERLTKGGEREVLVEETVDALSQGPEVDDGRVTFEKMRTWQETGSRAGS